MSASPLRSSLSIATIPMVAILSALAIGGCDKRPQGTDRRAAYETPRRIHAAGDWPKGLPIDARGVLLMNDAIKPAIPRARTFPGAKADASAAIRYDAPHRYAITEPPAASRRLRPMKQWEPMRALMMSLDTYALSDNQLAKTFTQIALAGAEGGEIWLFVGSSSLEGALRGRLLNAGMPQTTIDDKVRFHREKVDSIWFVDSSPLPIIDEVSGTFAFADFRYYHERPLDDGLPTVLSRRMDAFGYDATTSIYRAPINLEGGTLLATGDGVCITGSRQLVHMSCTPSGCDESIDDLPLEALQTHPLAVEMRKIVADYAGCKDLIVTLSVNGDATGHADMYLKPIDDETILVGEYLLPYAPGLTESNGPRLNANADFLAAYVRADGSNYTIKRLPMPGVRSSSWGPTPYTWINSSLYNGINIWPTYGIASWQDGQNEALLAWQEALPEMTHIGVEATQLASYYGAIHCVTRTIPAVEAMDWIDDGACGDGGRCDASGGVALGADSAGSGDAGNHTTLSPGTGYDGACRVGAMTADDAAICWGPAWLCDCNDCESGCGPPDADPCGGITFTGCCTGSVTRWCESGNIYEQDCGGQGCGWQVGDEYYGCGSTLNDPDGVNRRSCAICEPQCDGKTCGDDGCGGECGDCGEADRCVDDACLRCDDCVPGARRCEDGSVIACASARVRGVAVDGCGREVVTDCALGGETCRNGGCVAPESRDAANQADVPISDGSGDAPADDRTADATLNSLDDGCAAGSKPTGTPALPVLLFSLLGFGLWLAHGRSHS